MLSPETCKRRGIAAKKATRVKLNDHCLCFDHRAGYGNLVEIGVDGQGKAKNFPSDQVHGVVYELSQREWEALVRAEVGYRVIEVEVEPYEAEGSREKVIKASAFVSQEELRIQAEEPTDPLPTARYLSLIQSGAAFHKLDQDYLEFLDSLQGVQTVPRVNFDTKRDRSTRAVFAILVLSSLVASALASKKLHV
ncbi:butirosin biosynthesis BtrG-like protein [Chloropicon primus]|nr:butirosin biosynthesis BtrG-like protein [Chloropicon primus]